MKEVPGSPSRPQPAPSFEEMLSAYHDGELSPPEREAVERQLAASPEARQQLLEMRRLSGLLHELPQSQLPQEFSRQVLRAAEREMLIPRLRGTAPVARRRSWIWITAGLATSAAAMVTLMLALQLERNPEGQLAEKVADVRDVAVAKAPQPSPHDQGQRELTKTSPQPIVVNRAAKSLPPEAKPRTAESASGEQGSLADRDDIDRKSVASSTPKRAVEESESGAADQPALAADSVAGVKGGAGSRSGMKESRQKDLKAVRIVDAARRVPGGQAAVVRMVVVDQAAAMKVVQLVLDQNADASAEEQTAQGVAKAPPSADRKSHSAIGAEGQIDGLPCVLVEMSNDQLIAVVRKLLKDDPAIQSMEVDDPIALAELPRAPDEESTADTAPASELFSTKTAVAGKPAKSTPELPQPAPEKRLMSRASPSNDKSYRSADSSSGRSIALKDSSKRDAEPDQSNGKLEGRDSLPKLSVPAGPGVMKKVPQVVAKGSNLNSGSAPSRSAGNRAWVGQVPRQKFKAKTLAERSAANRRSPAVPLESELDAVNKPQPVDATKEPTSGPDALAKNSPSAASPEGVLPMHVLFVVEPKSVPIRIDSAPEKAKLPGKPGGSRGGKSRFSRQS